jgi:transcription elongation GreA/GreB family factor
MDSNNKGFVYLTKDRLHELETELNILKSKGRKEVAEKIAEARAQLMIYRTIKYIYFIM